MSRKYERMAYISDVPEIHLRVDAIAKKAENDGKYCIDGEKKGTIYVCDRGVINVVTGSNGFICMKEDELELMAYEILDIVEDLRAIRRAKRQICQIRKGI